MDKPYGERTLPEFIDFKATKVPQETSISIPYSTTDASIGWKDISFASLAESIDRTAHFLRSILPAPDPSIPTFA